jgi:hypothetical protein
MWEESRNHSFSHHILQRKCNGNMSKSPLQQQIEDLFSHNNHDQPSIIRKLDKLVDTFGIEQIKDWRNSSNKTRNTLMHELVERNYLDVVRHVCYQHHLDLDVHRELDGRTPIELAQLKDDDGEMCRLLKELENNKASMQNQEEDTPEPEKRKKMNIIWLDLEMTSIEDPKIMECAVIITDKDLNELDRGEQF